MTDTLSRWTIRLVAIIGAIAFILSYYSLVDVAARYSTMGWLAWLWPLVIDLPLIVFSLSAIRAALLGRSTILQWMMVGLYTLATLIFNLVHARSEYVWWAPWAVAAMPPLTLFLSFETLMGMVRQGIEGQAGQRVDRQSDIEPAITRQPDIDLTTLGPEDRQPYLLDAIDRGLSDSEIAEMFGKSVKTIERDRGRLNGH